ncbi:hypothetical protein RUM43_004674 [Polyplax serrata]|uniref:Uncharacterized protein n=1 Tax=Polyplax serrata TaxID=468196 RepID=A0AAN8SDL5_POLSC
MAHDNPAFVERLPPESSGERTPWQWHFSLLVRRDKKEKCLQCLGVRIVSVLNRSLGDLPDVRLFDAIPIKMMDVRIF